MVPHSCIECAKIVRISKLVWACRVTLEVLNFRSTIKFNPPLLCLFGRCFLFSREEPWLFVNNSPSSLHQPSWAWRINIKADNEHLGLLRCLRSFQFSSPRSHISISGDPTPPGSEIYWSQVLKLSLTGLIWCQSTGMISYVLGSPINLNFRWPLRRESTWPLSMELAPWVDRRWTQILNFSTVFIFVLWSSFPFMMVLFAQEVFSAFISIQIDKNFVSKFSFPQIAKLQEIESVSNICLIHNQTKFNFSVD